MVASLFGPWWTWELDSQASDPFTIHVNFGALSVTRENRSASSGQVQVSELATEGLPQTRGAFRTILTLNLLSIGLWGISAGLGTRSRRLSPLSLAIAILAFGCCAAANLFATAALPVAISGDGFPISLLTPYPPGTFAMGGFWGHEAFAGAPTVPAGSLGWFAGWAWYAALIGSGLLFVRAIYMFSKRFALRP